MIDEMVLEKPTEEGQRDRPGGQRKIAPMRFVGEGDGDTPPGQTKRLIVSFDATEWAEEADTAGYDGHDLPTAAAWMARNGAPMTIAARMAYARQAQGRVTAAIFPDEKAVFQTGLQQHFHRRVTGLRRPLRVPLRLTAGQFQATEPGPGGQVVAERQPFVNFAATATVPQLRIVPNEADATLEEEDGAVAEAMTPDVSAYAPLGGPGHPWAASEDPRVAEHALKWLMGHVRGEIRERLKLLADHGYDVGAIAEQLCQEIGTMALILTPAPEPEGQG